MQVLAQAMQTVSHLCCQPLERWTVPLGLILELCTRPSLQLRQPDWLRVIVGRTQHFMAARQRGVRAAEHLHLVNAVPLPQQAAYARQVAAGSAPQSTPPGGSCGKQVVAAAEAVLLAAGGSPQGPPARSV